MIILDQTQINNKIHRMAMEIYERHSLDQTIHFIGINNKGFFLAKKLCEVVNKLSPLQIRLSQLIILPSNPLANDVSIIPESLSKDGDNIILVDDVMNTGRTLFYACGALMNHLPKKVEVAVLVLRMHKSFPIHVDYYGLRLATTIKQNIEVMVQNQLMTEVQMF